MESIKISVTGNICNVTSKPSHITEGTVGLPVEFTFDSSWDGLCKTAVFMAGKMRMVVDSVNNVAIVPWEILRIPGFQLNVGVYGINVEGTTEISSTWVHAGAIQPAANGFNDPTPNPTIPVWQKLLNAIGNPLDLKTKYKGNLVGAINEVHTRSSSIIVNDTKPTITNVLWFNTSSN